MNIEQVKEAIYSDIAGEVMDSIKGAAESIADDVVYNVELDIIDKLSGSDETAVDLGKLYNALEALYSRVEGIREDVKQTDMSLGAVLSDITIHLNNVSRIKDSI